MIETVHNFMTINKVQKFMIEMYVILGIEIKLKTLFLFDLTQ